MSSSSDASYPSELSEVRSAYYGLVRNICIRKFGSTDIAALHTSVETGQDKKHIIAKYNTVDLTRKSSPFIKEHQWTILGLLTESLQKASIPFAIKYTKRENGTILVLDGEPSAHDRANVDGRLSAFITPAMLPALKKMQDSLAIANVEEEPCNTRILPSVPFNPMNPRVVVRRANQAVKAAL